MKNIKNTKTIRGQAEKSKHYVTTKERKKRGIQTSAIREDRKKQTKLWKILQGNIK